MEFRQLLYVVELAREKNFSRAAKKLHVAQPSLSQQLSKLERELGVTLFHRSTSSVELTYAGATFVEKAQKVLDLLDQMRQEMDDISQLQKRQTRHRQPADHGFPRIAARLARI